MKKYIPIFLILAILLPVSAVLAQYPTKTIENTYRLPSNKRVEMNLKFASHIQVGVWNRQEVGLKTILMRSDASLDSIHQVTVLEQGDRLSIKTDYVFDKKNGEQYHCWNCDGNPTDKNCICFRVSYEVLLPADANLELETISGDIEIRGLRGPIRAKTISGFVDLALDSRASSSLSFKSVTGEIYTDFDLTLDNGSSAYSKRLNKPINGGGPAISLESVSGDIYFRKN